MSEELRVEVQIPQRSALGIAWASRLIPRGVLGRTHDGAGLRCLIFHQSVSCQSVFGVGPVAEFVFKPNPRDQVVKVQLVIEHQQRDDIAVRRRILGKIDERREFCNRPPIERILFVATSVFGTKQVSEMDESIRPARDVPAPPPFLESRRLRHRRIATLRLTLFIDDKRSQQMTGDVQCGSTTMARHATFFAL